MNGIEDVTSVEWFEWPEPEAAIAAREAEAAGLAERATVAQQALETAGPALAEREKAVQAREDAFGAYQRELQAASLRMEDVRTVLRRQAEALKAAGIDVPAVPDLPKAPAKDLAPEGRPA